MAKIPRIEQGNRESGVVNTTTDNSLANMAGSLGGVSGSLMDAATVQELRERKRQAEALRVKQGIVDASDAGVLGLQVQQRVFDISEGLKDTYPDNPKAAMDAYLEAVRPEVEVLKKQAPNERVALIATKDAESAISSGLGRLQAWGSARDTQRVKGNIARKEYKWVNDAAEYTSIKDLKNAFTAVDADPDFEAKFGAAVASGERFRVQTEMTASMLGRFSEKEPITARSLIDSNPEFFNQYLKPAALKAARDATYPDMAKRDNEILVGTLLNAGEKGSTLVNLANGGKATASVIFDAKKSLALDRQKLVDDLNMSIEAKARANKVLDTYEKSIEAAAQWQRRITDPDYVGDDSVPAEFWIARDKVYASDSPNIEDLMKLDQMVINLDRDRRISPARATTLRQELGLDRGKGLAALKDVPLWRQAWTGLRTTKQDGSLVLQQEIEADTNGKGVSELVLSDIMTDYIQQMNDYQETKGSLPTGADNAKMARRAYYRTMKIPMPEELR